MLKFPQKDRRSTDFKALSIFNLVSKSVQIGKGVIIYISCQ